ncbi:MAG: pyridoxal phosphate-dependent aminotransferase [Bacteroidales bacterium]|jgi:aspartate/methionine/tyrosine aminotransferase|nr:pyridoxal phosphate-dependent aminotransferase [Bacteroidales bacterium]
MKNTPVDAKIVQAVIDSFHISDFEQATIREIVAISGQIEKLADAEFIHMEMGVPGLPAPAVGIDAEIDALRKGVASIYPIIDGLPELKEQTSRFIKAFIDIDIAPQGCVPVAGSMQGTFTSFLVCGQCRKERDTILFIDPGFPVQKMQLDVLDYKSVAFDVYDCRGEKLKTAVENFLKQGNIAAIIYSNPNNPAWICLNEHELKIIGELATQYDTVVLEDLAYFAMDFRHNLSVPFLPPFQPTVAHFTDNYILLISGSKAFSYAGQRIGVAAISNALYTRHFPDLQTRYGVGTFGSVFIHRALYAISSGTSHSAQYALAAMMKAASDGRFNFLAEVEEYARRARRMKSIFLKNGFEIVYDKDLDEPIGDGFYFTIHFPGMTGSELMKELLFYGISAISLSTTGSKQEGLRACTSFIRENQYELLDERLKLFRELRTES